MTHIGWTKNIDSAVLSADSTVSGNLSVSRLKTVDVVDPYRSNASDMGVTANFQQSIDINATMVAGINSTSIDYRVRLSNNDSTAKNGAVFDSGLQTATGKEFDPVHGLFVFLFNSTYNAQYIRVDIQDTSGEISLIEAGRWWVGKAIVPGTSFTYGWTLGVRDNTQRQQSPGAQIKINKRPQQQVIQVNFQSLDENEVNALVDTLLYEVGLFSDVLIVPDGVQDRRAFESIWGYIDNLRNRSHTTYKRYGFRMTVVERK